MKQRKIIMAVGKTGYGKSYYVKNTLIPMAGNRVIIFDIQNEYALDGWLVFSDVEEFQSYVAENNEAEKLKIILKFEEYEDYLFAFDIAYSLGDVMLVLEEVWNYCSPYSMTAGFEKLIRLGRHKSVSVIGTAHRFSDIHPLGRGNMDLLVSFRQSEKNDVKALADTSFVGKEGADRCARLGRYEHAEFFNL